MVQFWFDKIWTIGNYQLIFCANNENDDADNKPHPPGESFAAIVFQIPIVITHVVVISTCGEGGGIKSIVRGGFDLRANQQLHRMHVIQSQNSITYTLNMCWKKWKWKWNENIPARWGKRTPPRLDSGKTSWCRSHASDYLIVMRTLGVSICLFVEIERWIPNGIGCVISNFQW